MLRPWTQAAFGALFVVGLAAGWATPARACGGVFPGQAAGGLVPVDQAAERILFEVGAGTITAHLQLHYRGDAEDFVWIIPLPSVPAVAESDLERLKAVDQASSLTVELPPSGACLQDQPDDPPAASGCSCGGGTEVIAGRPPAPAGEPSDTPPVMLYASSYTRQFTYDVIESAYTPVLIDWLSTHGYHLGERMTPVLERYNVAGTKFLALRLRPGQDSQDLAPIALTFAGDRPTLPLELTAVAAQPYMSLLVMILGEATYLPENYVAIPPRSGEILFDEAGRTSYFEWVARAAAEANGHFFSLEYLGERPAALDGVSTARFLSRYYTRVSPEQMTLDPVFRPHPNQGLRYAAHLDLSQEESLYDCSTVVEARRPAACAFNYCGPDSECGLIGEQPACLCGPNTVATKIEGPDQQTRISCVPAENLVGLTAQETVFDPCVAVDCGLGTCAPKGLLATCACDAGAAAQLVGGELRCLPAPASMVTYGPGAGRESKNTAAVTAALRRPLGGPIFATFACLALLSRRRRR